MKVVQFKTPTSIPLEAFSLLGVNVKTSQHAIGRFGTGLKYAVAVILRHGGILRLFIDKVEYEFYLSKKDFRGKTFQQVRMRKRDGLVGKWLSSKALPFTTEFGKDWELWQAYRELESNTRDEGGETASFEMDDCPPDYLLPPEKGTMIQVELDAFFDSIVDGEVFLPLKSMGFEKKLVYSDPMVSIYDRPSVYLHYQGIRVFNLRYPARFTYDFKSPHVNLTEDRTAGNSWILMYHLARIIQNEVKDKSVLYKMLSQSTKVDRRGLTFETQDLNFETDSQGSDEFRGVVGTLVDSGSAGKSVVAFNTGRRAFISYRTASESVTLSDDKWNAILDTYRRAAQRDDLSDEERGAFEALERQLADKRVNIPMF